MSTELLAVPIAILAVVVTSLVEVTMYTKMSAADAALYLQGRRIREVVSGCGRMRGGRIR